MDKQVKLFIVEGEDRDYRFLQQMLRTFLKGKYEARVVALSAAQNIYMLYERLKDDDFETDLVELLRETDIGAREKLIGIRRQDISEIYLFFDYDIQEDNLPSGSRTLPGETIENMLEVFNNETENGKLYISYPMVEALYDFQDDTCEAFTDCLYPMTELSNYKRMVGNKNPKANLHYQYLNWKDTINLFALRIKCLFQIDELDYDYYRRMVDSFTVYQHQRTIKDTEGKVFVLSVFPEFLLDYFPRDFWNTMVRSTKLKPNCAEAIGVKTVFSRQS